MGQKWFEFEVEKDEQGRPVAFDVTNGPEIFGGFGNPDQLVLGPLMMGLKCWGGKGRKNHKRGDYYVSVAMAVADRIQEHLSRDVVAVVEEFKREAGRGA